jgi:hypothetical protein
MIGLATSQRISGSERTKSLNSWYYPTLAREEFAFWLFTAVSFFLLAGLKRGFFFMWRRRDTPSSDTLTWLWLHFLFIFFLLLIARTSQRLLSQRTNETNEKKVDNDIIETSLSPCWLMLYR